MKIAVTGGSGLVGRYIVRRLAENHEVLNLDTREPPERVACHVPCDILVREDLSRALDGADAVVHAAGIPGPDLGTEREIRRVNVEGTREVALAARACRIERVVFISSESVLGFVFSRGKRQPAYLPIDEEHPLSPTEPYGMSKLLAEEILTRHLSVDTVLVVLRPPWVWVPEEYDKCRRLAKRPDDWADGLWAYVHGEDLARAAEAALSRDLPVGRHTAYVAAPDNGTAVPTRTLLERFYPAIPLREEGLPEFGSLISSEGTHRLLAFRPAMSWREFLGSVP